MIRVAVLDDHPAVRAGLKAIDIGATLGLGPAPAGSVG
jgi:hypothetical protein